DILQALCAQEFGRLEHVLNQVGAMHNHFGRSAVGGLQLPNGPKTVPFQLVGILDKVHQLLIRTLHGRCITASDAIQDGAVVACYFDNHRYQHVLATDVYVEIGFFKQPESTFLSLRFLFLLGKSDVRYNDINDHNTHQHRGSGYPLVDDKYKQTSHRKGNECRDEPSANDTEHARHAIDSRLAAPRPVGQRRAHGHHKGYVSSR